MEIESVGAGAKKKTPKPDKEEIKKQKGLMAWLIRNSTPIGLLIASIGLLMLLNRPGQ